MDLLVTYGIPFLWQYIKQNVVFIQAVGKKQLA